MIIHVFSFKQNTNLVSDFKSGADEHLETLKFNQPKVSGTNIPRNSCLGCPTHKHIIRTCFSVGTITSFQKKSRWILGHSLTLLTLSSHNQENT